MAHYTKTRKEHDMIKRMAARLPASWQFAIRRAIYRRQIRRGTFVSPEAEFHRLAEWIKPGDWVVDMGANVGHFTCRMSDLVGPSGRVIAFEPITTTFALLALAVNQLKHRNVTLLNAAASSTTGPIRMGVPDTDAGLPNYYMAEISDDGAHEVLTVEADDVIPDQRIAAIKIDVEGHELSALVGAGFMIQQYHPILIVETRDPDVIAHVEDMGYTSSREGNSPNVVFLPA